MLKIAGLLAQSAVSQMLRLDDISNNLANANTVGYKRDETVFSSFGSVLARAVSGDEMSLKRLPYGVRIEGNHTIIKQAELRRTDNPLDLAISGNGFFVVQTPSGEKYTRAGNFMLDREGYLVTPEGNRVLGLNGPIQVNGGEVVINYLGEVMVDGEMVDKLRIVDFPKPYRLRKEGANLFVSEEAGFEPKGYKIYQGYLEDSSVNPVQEMVNMIVAHRAYEASANGIRLIDELLGRVLTEVPRL